MDDLDARIIQELTGPRALQWNVRRSYSTIAARLGVDGESVRRRVLRMERSGNLGGAELIPNPYLIGRETVSMDLKLARPEGGKAELVSRIGLIDGVVMIVDFQGDELQVLLYCEDEKVTHRRTELISSLSGCKDPLILRNVGFPHPRMRLIQTDWQILKALRREPRKSTVRIAEEIGTSSRTVERRIALLTQNNAFFHMFRPNFEKSEGLVCSAVVSYRDERRKSELDEKVTSRLERVVFSFTAAGTISQFNFVCRNLIEAEEKQRWIQEIGGVVQVRMGVIRRFILVTNWIDDEIERRLALSGS